MEISVNDIDVQNDGNEIILPCEMSGRQLTGNSTSLFENLPWYSALEPISSA